MPANQKTLRLLALGAAAALGLSPYVADSLSCADEAAGNLLVASYLDAALNPPVGEDLEFLYKDGGVPNIMVLFDSSGSMQMLPPDGAGKIGGDGSTKPPGYGLTSSDANNSYTLTNWNNALADATRVVGCGLDAISSTNAAWISSQTIQGIQQRRFYPPCGQATNMGLVGAPYQGNTTDYAASMTVCPYFTSSNNQATGAPGYDPDWYGNAGPTDTTKNGNAVFFGRDLVFHDNSVSANWTSNAPWGDGWSDTDVYPFKTGAQPGTIADYCATQTGNQPGTATTRESICNTCLTTAGWYYDGIILDQTDLSYAGKRPSLWYTGNYLNFFPPKFVASRKVVKDIISVQSRVRMGMMVFGGSGASKLQDFNPTCGQPDSSNFDSNRASYISDINNTSKLGFNNSTPLSQALFDIGRYYRSPANSWFGLPASNTLDSSGNSNQAAVCFSCQVSTVIILTDGVPSPVNEGSSLPAGTTTQAQADTLYAGDVATGIKGIGTSVCSQCGAFSGTDDYLNNLPRVAWYLHNLDLRKNTESTLDCKGMPGKQTLTTYTVGFATTQNPNASAVLSNTAAAGGGLYVGAENPSQLRDGINYILQEISNRSTSFSVATISTLQTTSGRAVIVPRFDPSKSAHWKGHLFRFDLYSEFVNKCTPKGAGDLDCDGLCASTFLQDNSGTDASVSLISEDGNGTFVRNEPTNRPICAQAPLCGSCAVGGTQTAVPFWDAGTELANRSWKARTVWTAVDANGDGRIDASDGVIKFEATDAAAAQLAPYMALGTSATGQSVCGDIANQLSTAGDTASAALVTASKTECAKTIVRYVLGADIFNELGKKPPAWPPASQDSLWDRAYKLGDIFHSSPVVVDPPLPRQGLLCPSGLSNQCLVSLFKTPTKNGDAGYDAYSLSSRYYNRDKFILVGANDGLLHAFHGGTWRAGADDPYTSAVDESKPPFNGYFDRGTAAELWAFLPPDLLAKIPLFLGTKHHFFVDGTPMVRDVWVDGTTNGLGGPSARDDFKDGSEFHTVAVVGERRGGNRWFALDVTDAATQAARPGFLWIYPQPTDPESTTFGESFDDYLPTAPPIGPVRIEAGGTFPANGNTPEVNVPGVGTPVKYHERWIVFLNGGYDPQYVRGRGVHMLDVWTGKELFDFSYTPTAVGDPRENLRYPVAGTVGMMAWGRDAFLKLPVTHDGFFDSAGFGDTGGQLWMIRFFAPGQLDASGHATNWFGGRAFQMTSTGTCKLCAGQPFFNITSDTPVQAPGSTEFVYRTLIGTGDRFNLLDKNGGTCGPDNLRACALRGCTVTVTAANNYVQAADAGQSLRGLSVAACGDMTNTQSDAAFTACTPGGRAQVVVSGCPGALSTTKDMVLGCTLRPDGYRCDQTISTAGDKLAISDATNPINFGNWFFGLSMFQKGTAREVFWDLAGAKAYDAARIKLTQTAMASWTATAGLRVSAASNNAGGTPATMTDPGWAIYYDHGPTATIDYHQYTVAWQDERTSSSAAVGSGLITWNTTQPSQGEVVSTSGSCRASKCTAQSRRVSYHYAADALTGMPKFTDPVTGALLRSQASYLLVPSQADQRTVFVNQQGQVAVGLTAVNPEKGATNVGMTDPMDPTNDAGFLEVDQELHACRHVDGTTTPPSCK
jgi:type IV pilus assembly protein PilY1